MRLSPLAKSNIDDLLRRLPELRKEFATLNPSFDHKKRSLEFAVKHLPRHAGSKYMLGTQFKKSFQGKSVLDIGCRVEFFRQPHASYYKSLGASVAATDLRPLSWRQQLLFRNQNIPHLQADLMALPLKDKAFDFVTVPMIMGQGNPLDRALLILFALQELERVIKDDGLVYIAEHDIDTRVIYIAQQLGWNAYYQAKEEAGTLGIPAGIFLAKLGENQFAEALEALIEIPHL
ncbi:MAG: methyltransferase domain-containing protein [bacterium]